jgi:hypothetical protein
MDQSEQRTHSSRPSFQGATRIGSGFIAGLCLVSVMGCNSLELTKPKRSVAEQLLLSSAADRAVAQVNFTALRDRAVFVDERYFESYDKGYALGCIRQAISESGARLVDADYKADLIVEVRSGALGIDNRGTLFGIPAVTLPIPLAGPVETPEIAFYKSDLSDSTANFALFAYERSSGKHVDSSGALNGNAYFHHYVFLGFFNWRNTDIDQLDPKIGDRLRGKKK